MPSPMLLQSETKSTTKKPRPTKEKAVPNPSKITKDKVLTLDD